MELRDLLKKIKNPKDLHPNHPKTTPHPSPTKQASQRTEPTAEIPAESSTRLYHGLPRTGVNRFANTSSIIRRNKRNNAITLASQSFNWGLRAPPGADYPVWIRDERACCIIHEFPFEWGVVEPAGVFCLWGEGELGAFCWCVMVASSLFVTKLNIFGRIFWPVCSVVKGAGFRCEGIRFEARRSVLFWSVWMVRLTTIW